MNAVATVLLPPTKHMQKWLSLPWERAGERAQVSHPVTLSAELISINPPGYQLPSMSLNTHTPRTAFSA